MEFLNEKFDFINIDENPLKIERRRKLDYVNDTYENYRGSEQYYRDNYGGFGYIPNVFKIMEDYTNGKLDDNKELYKEWSKIYQESVLRIKEDENKFYELENKKNLEKENERKKLESQLTIIWQ